MPGVNIPSSTNSDPLKTIVPMVGTAVGSYFGGPAGGIAGNKVGTALVTSGPDPHAVQDDAQGSAIDRRLGTLNDHPSVQLAQAQAALEQMPPDVQQQYGPTIAAARQMDIQGGN